jgi:ATP-dependent RNA helicase DHX37/DHR1
LLREISEDFTLKKYSAIIIDEAHERTVNTDVLIALMSRCVKARTQLAKEKPQQYTPLKLIIMSATLQVSDFRDNGRLFSIAPPLVEVEGRQYEVTPHWSRRTTHDYLDEMFNKVSRGHRKLPPGGILVFLTGQSEIQTLARRLRDAFGAAEGSNSRHPPIRINPAEMPTEAEDLEFETSPASRRDADDAEEDSDSDVEITVNDDADNEFVIEGEESATLAKVHVLPLYSQLPSKEQLKVFDPPPEGSRLIVLATNVAETSLTIPGIRYVFDSGRAKERQWDSAGVQTFVTTWISKASADQRMGRAGRTGPGHCYRLYSSAVYELFQDFAEPEIFRSPLEGVVLQLKSLGLPRVDNFPFPTPPVRVL